MSLCTSSQDDSVVTYTDREEILISDQQVDQLLACAAYTGARLGVDFNSSDSIFSVVIVPFHECDFPDIDDAGRFCEATIPVGTVVKHGRAELLSRAFSSMEIESPTLILSYVFHQDVCRELLALADRCDWGGVGFDDPTIAPTLRFFREPLTQAIDADVDYFFSICVTFEDSDQDNAWAQGLSVLH